MSNACMGARMTALVNVLQVASKDAILTEAANLSANVKMALTQTAHAHARKTA